MGFHHGSKSHSHIEMKLISNKDIKADISYGWEQETVRWVTINALSVQIQMSAFVVSREPLARLGHHVFSQEAPRSFFSPQTLQIHNITPRPVLLSQKISVP
jgi:hypothetical protein